MTLQGKGFFISHLPDCEGGEPGAFLAAVQAAGLSNVFIKIADGVKEIGVSSTGVDLTAPVVQSLQHAGITVWGWQYVYGDNPSAEATLAITRTQALGLEGYVVSTGAEYERPGMSNTARQFITTVRAALKVPVALSSFRFPNYHPRFPWSAFLASCDLHMPQVYWEQTHDASKQLIESRRQCDSLPNARPYIPTGAAYSTAGWSPTARDITDFLDTAQTLGLPAVNFFDWDTCQASLPLLWKAITSFPWPAQPQYTQAARSVPAIAGTPTSRSSDALLFRFLAALNKQNAAQATALYDPSATQVLADQIRRGVVSIQAGFTAFFTSLPSGTVFNLSSAQAHDDLQTFAWKAGPLSGETILTLKDGKIILDYTFIF
jgi:hypothetical protein